MFKYLKSLIKVGTNDSSKAFSLVLSAIIGALIGLCVCFVLIYDALSDGYVSTNLMDLGVFLLCTGAYMFGGGATKIFSEGFDSKVKAELLNFRANPEPTPEPEEVMED